MHKDCFNGCFIAQHITFGTQCAIANLRKKKDKENIFATDISRLMQMQLEAAFSKILQII